MDYELMSKEAVLLLVLGLNAFILYNVYRSNSKDDKQRVNMLMLRLLGILALMCVVYWLDKNGHKDITRALFGLAIVVILILVLAVGNGLGE